jgi:hypothetical protein
VKTRMRNGWSTDARSRRSVTYNANGGTGGSVPSDASAYGATASVQGNPGGLVKGSQTFGYWNTAVDGCAGWRGGAGWPGLAAVRVDS